MSVPEYRRKEGKFEVLNVALGLCCYTLKITGNEKIFLPEFKEKITNEINNCALRIYTDAWAANDIMVREGYEGPAALNRRLELQSSAISHCTRLLSLINIAKKVFHLKEKRMDYWTEQIVKTRSLLRQWKDSDKQRYKNMLGL